MTGKVFLDSNIAVYAADRRDSRKQRRAEEVLLEADEWLVVSTQVLQETFASLTRKARAPHLVARAYVLGLANYEVVSLTPDHIRNAIDYSDSLRISFWDALIVAAAESANCAAICTEDLNSGQTIRGMRIWNPFT
jgi:predicted nucleic acid-binding protein